MNITIEEIEALVKATDDTQGAIDQSVALRQKWLDAPFWQRLYAKYGVRKPPYYLPCTPSYMRRWFSKSGISTEEYMEMTGFKNLAQYGKSNPHVPLWVLIGNLLEAREEQSKKSGINGALTNA